MKVRGLFLVFLLMMSVPMEAKTMEVPLPFDTAELAAQGARKLPEFIKVSGENGILNITISEHDGRGGYNEQYTLPVEAVAGNTVTLTVEVKADNIAFDGGIKARSLGRINFGGVSTQLPDGEFDWKKFSFKKVRIPGNGKLKFRISLHGFSGEVSFRNPRIRGDISRRDLKKLQKELR